MKKLVQRAFVARHQLLRGALAASIKKDLVV
jgi:hypothetical protein